VIGIMSKSPKQKTEGLRVVGHSVIRVDAHAKVTGAAEFSGDRVGDQRSRTHIINSFAAHFAEVEVDPDSGAVRVLRYVAAHDSGRIVHPEAARGQIVGGELQGIEPDPCGPYGAKALGEPPLVFVAAAIANVVYDAVGVRVRELPITAEKVLRGLRANS